MLLGMPSLVEFDTLAENAALCRALGLDFVELNLNLPQFQAPSLDREALRYWQEQGVRFTLHLDERMDVCDFNRRVAAAYVDTALEAAALSMEYGFATLNMHMNPGVYFTLPNQKLRLYEKFRDPYLDSLCAFRDAMTARVGDAPLRVCVENTDGWLPFEREGVETLLQSPVFALTLDIGHAHAAGNGDLPFYTQHQNRLRHMHLHDAAGGKNHLPLGEGEIDLPAFVHMARQQNASLVIEVKTAEALRRSAAYFFDKLRDPSSEEEELQR